MNKRILLILIAFLVLMGVGALQAQEYKVHSHNDYAQRLPFWYAYSNGAASIEADIFFKDNELYVTHGENEIVQKIPFKNCIWIGYKACFNLGNFGSCNCSSM